MRWRRWACVVFAGVLVLAGCTRVDLLNAAMPRSGYSVIKDVAYGEGERRYLDIYVPDHLAPGHPVIVFYYGGSWQEGTKNDYLFVGQAFASKGYIAVIADYRLYPDVYFPAFMNDSAAAFVWAHNHIAAYGGNPQNVFVAGHSAGGYNALMLTLNTSYMKAAGGDEQWIRGAIGIAGPYDFLPLTDPKLIDMFSKQDVTLTQPITYARSGVPPILLLAGDQDTDVLPRNTINLTKCLRTLGDPVKEIIYPGVAHIGIILALADGFRGKAPVLNDIADFIDAHTKQ